MEVFPQMHVDHEVKEKILVVEDSPEYQLMLRSTLEQKYQLEIVVNGGQALQRLKDTTFSLIIIDLVLPDMSGLQVCSFVKSQEVMKDTPVILLTGQSSIEDKVLGLDHGANDYITKPFDCREFLARVRSQLRHRRQATPKLSVPGFSIDLDRQRLHSHALSQDISLTRMEFKLFIYFAQRIDHVISRSKILDEVWPGKLNLSERTVDSHLSHLRRKLSGSGMQISAVHGCGYRCQLAHGI